jgi:phage terminase large subunit-like protein
VLWGAKNRYYIIEVGNKPSAETLSRLLHEAIELATDAKKQQSVKTEPVETGSEKMQSFSRCF